jgi:alkanesulfonate monooxygenase
MLEPQEGMRVEELINWARYAEKLGFGYIFRSDHLLPTDGKDAVDSPECWTTLGALATSTRKIRFGPLVSPIGFRNPALLARMACTVDSASAGRLRLGMGAGWFKDEYIAHGLPFPDFKTRKEQFVEAVRIIRPLTAGKRVDFDGNYFSAHTSCYPKPKGKLHLIIGGRTIPIIMVAAREADEWNFFSTKFQTYKKLRAVFDRSVGDRRVEVSRMGSVFIAENHRSLEKRIRAYMKSSKTTDSLESIIKEFKSEGVFFGLVDDLVLALEQHMEAGVSKFYFQLLNPSDRELPHLVADVIKNRL